VKFILDAEQKLFGETLDKLLSAAGTPGVARDWAAGTHGPGLALWRSLAGAGVFALAVPESAGGAGLLPVELVTAFGEIGRHGVPGPYAETVAVAVLLARLGSGPLPAAWLPRIAEGSAIASLALPPAVPYALDTDAADVVLTVDGGTLRSAIPGPMHTSLDPARRLFSVTAGDPAGTSTAGTSTAGTGVVGVARAEAAGPGVAGAGVAGAGVAGAGVAAAAAEAYDMGGLMCAAQLAGIGDRLLEVTVDYAKTRRQFGRPIGEFQAVKHHLANAYVTLEYARPLVYGAALAYGSPDFPREVSAAKAATSDATYLASRIALQVHGAIGYTDEYDLSLLIRKARALRTAWGSPAAHRARVIASLTDV
jgi:alkylation response protein AidB-like acyl-CoA dehydrogenase